MTQNLKFMLCQCIELRSFSNKIHAIMEKYTSLIHEKNPFICKFCDKKFRMIKVYIFQCSVFKKVNKLYYNISTRAFQKPMSEFAHPILKYKIPNLRLHLRLRLRRPKFPHLCLRLRLRPKKITFGRPLLSISIA